MLQIRAPFLQPTPPESIVSNLSAHHCSRSPGWLWGVSLPWPQESTAERVTQAQKLPTRGNTGPLAPACSSIPNHRGSRLHRPERLWFHLPRFSPVWAGLAPGGLWPCQLRSWAGRSAFPRGEEERDEAGSEMIDHDFWDFLQSSTSDKKSGWNIKPMQLQNLFPKPTQSENLSEKQNCRSQELLRDRCKPILSYVVSYFPWSVLSTPPKILNFSLKVELIQLSVIQPLISF